MFASHRGGPGSIPGRDIYIENILTMRAQAEQNAAHMASLQKYLTEFKDNVTEELNNQSDMLTDITNNLQVKFIFHSWVNCE